MIGVIMLTGIVVNNSIVLVDVINQLRWEGKLVQEAIITGSALRLRPILMTAATTMLAMLPLALGIGEGSELQAPLAAVVIGGLLTSTILTLFVTPVLYSLVASRKY
jgi:HAE1 family hydrophobic/amphiphilic exporter-1